MFLQVCPCDMAPTWRQRQIDDLRSWGLDCLSSFCTRFGYIPRKTSKSIPIFGVLSMLCVHPSKPCSFDSFSGHGQNAASSRMVSKIPSNIQLWLHFTCNCSCYRWTVPAISYFRIGKDGLAAEMRRSGRRISAAKPSFPILK